MALFDVPGWTVPTAPVAGDTSRKRKRKAEPQDEKVQSATINFETLMEKLEASQTDGQGSLRKKQKKQDKKGTTPQGSKGAAAPDRAERPREGGKRREKRRNAPQAPGATESLATPARKGKKGEKEKHSSEPPQAAVPARQADKVSQKPEGLTALQAGMKSSLDGARFRWINELLYKSDSAHAHELMREDPKVYEEYHTGFRHQVHSWPTNPVSHFVSLLAEYPPKTVIADLGCGDAALARALVPRGFAVFSFDLVADGVFVVEADTCVHLPLPGSEEGGTEPDAGVRGHGEGAVVDVVVCALSLMGTNWPNCMREAWRVLRPHGELKIAEVASRFTDVDAFVSLVCSFGFQLTSKNDDNTHFTLFDFKKVARTAKTQKEWKKMLSRGSILKPCEYKRR
ncbi:uncharacterized protein FIBRA_07060 [Fibroporia radiculosa]|uniref:Ribosomal RNA-processing protein 8 n=1 Tax=Fibroporia radiculosa TaxID=599839 RepID=J4I034_9APHY|nr:uncharacterized protein FIBRA_07060 [Fibroporia radiculosa]CCM04867.1 predicted protein [Fibroporia radiculosa]